ncbi:hypothetical protein TWF102_005353 [Orbilia oligospora]|uniref:Uncharacterized protein n=1 Tax=Orbilia oligospora TaxID=2813651 RepID=A0A7C8JA99_ORBOL|nr:hypothetical protein TWF102_005353 [Orbilia oligospora]KAF3114126.1 hypothetical protein TWF103_001553 [Orbilia oligospora]
MGIFEKLSQKIELFKLEQRYTKRSRRTTFICDAYYIDGEYIYGPSMTQKNPNVSVQQIHGSVSSASTKKDRRKSVFGAY